MNIEYISIVRPDECQICVVIIYLFTILSDQFYNADYNELSCIKLLIYDIIHNICIIYIRNTSSYFHFLMHI